MTTNVPAPQSHMTQGLPSTFAPGGASSVFGASKVDAKSMSEGVGASFAIVSFRGKVWRIKYRGEEHNLVDPPAQPGYPPQPKAVLEAVLIYASPAISRIFYEKGYTEGSTEAPDCFSTNGVSPDPASPKVQCATCAACPRAVWGSKMTPTGKAGKQCNDSKRIAILPAGDLANETFGGPMLLRIPAASLGDMASYSSYLQSQGYPYFAVVTALSFDHNEAYPKLVFSAMRPLNDAEAQIVLAAQQNPQTIRMLSEAVDQVRHEPGPVAMQPTATAAPATAPVPALAAPVPAVPPVPLAPMAPALDPSYTYTPDNKHRWKAGMASWEPVPEPAPVPPPPPAPTIVAPPPPPPAPVAAPLATAPVPAVVTPQGNADGLDIPPALRGPAAPPAAPAIPTAPTAPPPMLPGEDMAAYVARISAVAGAPVAAPAAPAPAPTRRRRAAAPAPSPQPTPEAPAPVLTPQAPVASAPPPPPAPPVPATPMQTAPAGNLPPVPPPAPTESVPASLDAELEKLLNG